MKTNLIAALLLSAAITVSTADYSCGAEAGSKSKAKASTSEKAKKSEAKKTEAKKSEPTTKAKSKSGDAAPAKGPDNGKSAEIKAAEEALKVLDTAKKASLTKFLNSAAKKELMTLPGIGDALADAIIKARPLESAAHLVTVEGVGEKTFAEIVKSRK